MKQILVMLYPVLCYFEIAAPTEFFAFEDDWQLTTVGAEQKLYVSEEHMPMLAQQDFSAVDPLAADLLILPGIDDYHVPLKDQRNIDFLKRLNVTVKRPVIAAMSSSPILLAKAGLLEHTQFTGGIFEETYALNPFIPKQNVVREPVVTDHGIITSSFQFFREFAVATIQACGFQDVGDEFLAPARTDRPYTPAELTFHLPTE